MGDWSFLKEWGREELDIGSGKDYPSNALSNFAPHPFIIDGVECNSMEGFLQSLKFKDRILFYLFFLTFLKKCDIIYIES